MRVMIDGVGQGNRECIEQNVLQFTTFSKSTLRRWIPLFCSLLPKQEATSIPARTGINSGSLKNTKGRSHTFKFHFALHKGFLLVKDTLYGALYLSSEIK
ncbi:unnamed protein product [Cuscuta epithymum]|uniref:Uncharacterized protein n=1 Tax=Cuscuta epithymum TaxID=186058 RepID=A0AAV0GF89_9ASTE|nr:unnamed protein product [Cuscuta epithymum]